MSTYGSMCNMQFKNTHKLSKDKLDSDAKVLDRVKNYIVALRETCNLDLKPMLFMENAQCEHNYVYFAIPNTLKRVTGKAMERYAQIYQNRSNSIKFINIKGAKLAIIFGTNKWRAQMDILPQCFLDMFDKFKLLYDNTIGVAGSYVRRANNVFSSLFTHDFKLFILDIFSFLFKLKDSYFTPYTCMGLIISLYTLHSRYTTIFKPQAGPDSFELCLGTATLLGLPEHILNHIKAFTALTGKRIFDSELLMDVAKQTIDAIISIVEWISEPLTGVRIVPQTITNYIIDTIRFLGGAVYMHARIKKICTQYTKYISNSAVLFDPTFRNECETLYKECKDDNNFLSYINNSTNKHFTITWKLYESNLIKSCRAFAASSREEPICFVFEGKAGSGKSTIMNRFVDMLRARGLTTYCHSVPSAMDGKDFYDDYENQDIFIMDDVGQQGVSQWRYIINYVSPVRYPLPCAAAEKKNTKFFNSKYIFCTTNHFKSITSFTSTDCISEPEALFRRVHLVQVDSDRDANGAFIQRFSYFKFDHKHTHKWENKFLHHFKTDNVPVNFDNDITQPFNGIVFNDPTQASLTKLYYVFAHIVKCHESDVAVISEQQNMEDLMSRIDNIVFGGFQPQTRNNTIMDSINNTINWGYTAFTNNVHALGFSVGVASWESLYDEFIGYYLKYALDRLSSITKDIYNYVIQSLTSANITVGLCAATVALSATMIWYFKDMIFGKTANTIEFSNKNLEITHSKWVGEGITNNIPERIQTIGKLCKTLVTHTKDESLAEMTQCVVSGNRILVPAHIELENKFIDLYQTYQHYKNKHVEIENVRVRKVKAYLTADLAIYEIIDTIPLYKLNWNLFNTQKCTNPNLFLVNSSGAMEVVLNKNIVRNDHPVEYSTVLGNIKHDVDTGFYTPYSASGGCGTVLVSAEEGIIGFHVAGNGGNCGFCVTPNSAIAADIRSLMTTAKHANFELDDKIIEDFSGVRIRYDNSNKPDINYISGDTDLIKTGMHIDYNDDMKILITDIANDPSRTLTPVVYDDIRVKVPPNYYSGGNPVKTMKNMARKTFKRQGAITTDELSFLKAYLRTLMTRFDDLSDEEVAFGGKYTKPLNKDSSNGYGCLKGKEAYFDFQNKIIKDEAKQLFEQFRKNAEIGDYSDYTKYMCRETFKDELRLPDKADKPRTFRVMPLGHIWWCKKIFGKLVNHFKETMHETGIGVGFNPYKDFDILAKKLRKCVKTGDIDFGKWDGSILALLMMTIAEVFGEYYDGRYGYMIEFLFMTMAKSFVLISDEIWATTHGLPSGTWLTLLVNCLLNKLITALTIYRNKINPSVEDVWNVVDYVMGDDKIIGAESDMAEVFNLRTIKEVAESLGMDCTNGDKTPIVSDSHPFDKLTFVKRHITMHPILQRYVGALSLETLTSTLMWRFGNKEETEVMEGKMRSVLVESYLHSPALTSRFRQIFDKVYPFAPTLEDSRIRRILDSDDGYNITMLGLGKDFYY